MQHTVFLWLCNMCMHEPFNQQPLWASILVCSGSSHQLPGWHYSKQNYKPIISLVLPTTVLLWGKAIQISCNKLSSSPEISITLDVEALTVIGHPENILRRVVSAFVQLTVSNLNRFVLKFRNDVSTKTKYLVAMMLVFARRLIELHFQEWHLLLKPTHYASNSNVSSRKSIHFNSFYIVYQRTGPTVYSPCLKTPASSSCLPMSMACGREETSPRAINQSTSSRPMKHCL